MFSLESELELKIYTEHLLVSKHPYSFYNIVSLTLGKTYLYG